MATARRRDRVEVLDLDDRARRVLARRHPEVRGAGGAFVVVADPEIRDALRQAVDQLATAANKQARLRTEELVESLLTRIEVPRPEALEQARRQTTVRLRVLRDFGAYSAEEVADMAGSRAANRSALAARWRREGRVLAVAYDNREHYLGFQFDEAGRPLPAVAGVLTALAGWPAWDVALWFVTDNPWLERQRPVDLVVDHGSRVVRTAQADAAARGERGDGQRQPRGRFLTFG